MKNTHKYSVKKENLLPVTPGLVERRIYLIRGQKVMLDSDLADLYQVFTKNLNKAVKRNSDRFPEDFMFQLTDNEADSLRFQLGTSNLRSQIATSKEKRGGRRYLPYVFTEQGVAMLSSVLNSKRAIAMNIVIIRAFVRLREIFATHKDLAIEMEKLQKEQKLQSKEIKQIFLIIEKLLTEPIPEKPKIGFRTEEAK